MTFHVGQQVRFVEGRVCNDYLGYDDCSIWRVRDDGRYVVAIGCDDDLYDVFSAEDLIPVEEAK